MKFNKYTENYFQLYGLPESYEVDLPNLEQMYFALQRQFHPDKFINTTGAEKIAAAGKSITINDGYKTLKDDLHRGEYILFLNGIMVNADKKTSVQPCKILLAEAMEMREKLLDADNVDEVQKLENTANKLRQECESKMASALKNKKFDEAAQLATRMKYQEKFVDEIRIKRLQIK